MLLRNTTLATPAWESEGTETCINHTQRVYGVYCASREASWTVMITRTFSNIRSYFSTHYASQLKRYGTNNLAASTNLRATRNANLCRRLYNYANDEIINKSACVTSIYIFALFRAPDVLPSRIATPRFRRLPWQERDKGFIRITYMFLWNLLEILWHY